MCQNIKGKQIFGLSTLSTDKAQFLLTWPLNSSERCFVYKHLTIIILIFTYFDLRKGEHSALFCFPSLSMTLKCRI